MRFESIAASHAQSLLKNRQALTLDFVSQSYRGSKQVARRHALRSHYELGLTEQRCYEES